MILKAIHNRSCKRLGSGYVASHHANLWFWKQFTTIIVHIQIPRQLRVITQTYDFESNSQLNRSLNAINNRCESSRKPMILKAIHNRIYVNLYSKLVASHHANLWFWKQFTTYVIEGMKKVQLRVITQTYDFESNSQLVALSPTLGSCCESSRKPMILKAIHNKDNTAHDHGRVASHHANLWFWKQFTTHILLYGLNTLLRVITQTYDFESNSQPLSVWTKFWKCCESSRKPMILKAIHNFHLRAQDFCLVASHHANLWFWKQFTTLFNISPLCFWLRVITQTYDFESNSQHRLAAPR